MVIFDIPEEQSAKRRQFRNLLKSWQFQQVQKSVWTSDYNYKILLVEAIETLGLGRYVQTYECLRLFPET